MGRLYGSQSRSRGRAERTSDADLSRTGGWITAIAVDARRERFLRAQFSPEAGHLFSLRALRQENIYRVLVEGGEAEMLTDVKGSVGGFKVSPDGKTSCVYGI